MTLASGTRLGPYEILSPLGVGGMGEVYRARDARLGRDVAVKVLPEEFAKDAERLRRFEREARSASALSHAHVVAVYDVGHEGASSYIVTEIVEGGDLRNLLDRGPAPLRRALDLAAQIASGLSAAHEQGIVHRDLKPENILLTKAGEAKIADFGLAKLTEASGTGISQLPTSDGRQTTDGVIMGTVAYMSPEQASGRVVDFRSDQFAFGSILYELLSGQTPFRRATAAETMTAILREEPEPLANLSPRVATPIVWVVERCLAKEPAERYAATRDLANDLGRLRTALSEPGSMSSAVNPVAVAAKRSSTLPRWLGVLALTAGAAMAGYFLRTSRPSAEPDWSDATLTPLTTDPGYEGEPTFSPDGQTIAYVSDRGGNFDIYLQQISGGPAINLTQTPAADIQPAFSPDGREIAFVSNRSGGSDIMHAAPGLPLVGGDIWVMPALGGPARRIVENGYSPSWTPDGASLLYVHGSFRNAKIARISAAGGDSRDVPIDEPFVYRYFYPRLSEDGRWLLYQNGFQVEVVPAVGGKARVLAGGQAAAWGPGSTSVLFTNATPGKSNTLWRAPFSLARGEFSGSSRPLTFGRGADLGVAASKDGTAIAFSAVDESLNLEVIPFDAEAGRVTGSEQELTSGLNHLTFFSPASDGRAVVFAAERGAATHLWRLDPPAPPVELTRDPRYSEDGPEWSPDGRSLAFSRREVSAHEGSLALWTMRTDGTNPRRIANFSGQMSWLPDGKILVGRDDQMLSLDLASGAAVPIPGVKARTLFAVDGMGQWIVYQSNQGDSMNVMAVPVGGGTPRLIATAPYDAYHPFFSPSGRWLYFQPGHKNLYRVPGPAQGWVNAAPQKVTDFSGSDLYIEEPRISRDGSRLFYTRGRRTGDIFILRPSSEPQKKTNR